METINNPALNQEERLAALRAHLGSGPRFPDWLPESNNHIHTCYSFSPYTPSGAALRAREAGLRVIGSVDHDSLAAAPEMRAACEALGMGAVTGFEIRAFLHDDEAGLFSTRKLNNPDSAGIAYLTVQGVPAWARERVAEFLTPVRRARRERTLAMADRANEILVGLGLEPFDPETDMMSISQFANGGSVTERHLLAAMATALIRGFGRGSSLVDGLDTMGLVLSGKARDQLADPENPYVMYDLLGVMKAEYLDRIYLQPARIGDGGECYNAADVVAFADSIGAVATYAYLGDVTASPTGDKKAEKFEDEFLDELFAELNKIGFRAITYMPPRNTEAQIQRIHELSVRHGMLEISGVDINQPRQSFTCPELRRPELAALNEATWALVAHEVVTTADPGLSLLGTGRLAPEALAERIARYAPIGRALADGMSSADAVATLGGKDHS